MPVPRTTYRLLFLTRLSVSIGIIAYLVWIVDWKHAAQVISMAALLPLLVVPGLLVIRVGLAAWRWSLILSDNQVKFSFWQAYTGYLVGACYDVFLPGVIGGDVIRIGRSVRQTQCPVGAATASVLLERVSGVFALLAIFFVAYRGFPAALSPLIATEATASITVVAGVGMVAMTVTLLSRQRWMGWIPQQSGGRAWNFVRSGLQTLLRLRSRTLVAVLVLSLLFQAVDIVITLLLAHAIGLTVQPVVFFAVIPIVYVATLLPISLGGLGVREGTLVFLLARFGVATSAAVTLSLLVYLCRILVGGTGGIVQFIESLATHRSTSVAESTKTG